MPDTWGLQQFPTVASTDDSAPGDKALTVIGAAIQAAVNADLAAVWGAAAPGTEPVQHVFTWDPKHKFNEAKLPALYIFEASSATEVTGDEIDADIRVLTIYWVARMSSAKHETARETARHVIGKIVSRLCKNGRHPAWRLAGDTDPVAVTRGSFLLAKAGVNSMVRLQATPLELTIELPGDSDKIIAFRGWSSQIRITELSTIDASVGTSPNIGEGTYTTNGDPTTAVTQPYPAP